MADIIYSNNPNDDSVQVQIEGKYHKTSLVRSIGSTEVIYQNNPNINKVLFTGEDGKKHTAILVKDVNGGGGDQHNLGYYADLTALQTAHPTATAGDWAIVGTTDTVWIWDTDTSAFVDSDRKGQVSSVNNQTGDVVLDAEDVGAQATLVSGTNIKTINNESLLGSGNINISGGGIEWAAHIDKPANAQTGTWNTNSVWEITGGLPDGLYEYYFKVLVNNNYNTPTTVVYKVMFKLWTDNGTQYADGDMRYVIDGDWQPRDISDRLPQNSSWSDVFWKKGSDLIIYNSNPPFYSRISAASDAVANVFEITAITNVNTGDKYIPTGHIYNLDEEQSWDGFIGGMILYNLVQIPETPTYCYSSGWYREQDERLLLMLGENSTGTIGTTGDARHVSEVDFSAESTMGGKFHVIIENSYHSYKAKILEATGDLANARILANEAGVLIFDANFSTGDSRSVYASLGMKGSSSSKKAKITTVDTSWLSGFQTVLTFDTVGAPITPKNLGVIAQYNEEIPNVAYTKGCFYQATGTVVTVQDDITCEETGTTIGATITCTNVSGFINALATEFGSSTDDVKYWLGQPNSTIQYTEGQNAYWNIPGLQIPGSIITTYFSFSPALQTDDFIVWEMTFTPEHQEVQNPAWELVQLGLTGITGYDATKTQVLKNTTGTLTWVDEV